MAEFCNCALGYGNTGRKNDALKKLIGIIPVYKYANDGTRNGIGIADTVNDAYVTALINQADYSKRWFPIQDVKNVDDVRAETAFETFNDGTKARVRQGARTFTGQIINQGPIFLGKLQAFQCAPIGFYGVDDCHNLIGSVSSDGQTLYPIGIQDGSWDAMLAKGTDSTIGRVQIMFDVAYLEQDSSLRQLEGLDFAQYTGLLDVLTTISNISTTGFTATLTLAYGAFQEPIPATGYVAADFDLFNVTDNASVTITSVAETADGVYAFVMPAQTVADVLRFTLDKDGYEMDATSITI